MAHVCMLFVSKTSEISNYFMDQMMFSVDMLNTKVVDNFLILFVLKFYDFSPTGLGVIDFTSLLSAFACALNRSE